MPLTSRERVIKAINHQEPDRIPLDLNPLFDFYIDLKKYLNLDIEDTIKHNLAMEVIPHPNVLKRLNIDVISVKLGSPKSKTSENRTDGLVKDDWGIMYN